MDITPAIRAHVEEKVSKLPKFYDLIQEIEVICEAADPVKKVEVIVTAEHRNKFVASSESEDLYGCIDLAVHKVERQLTDHKERFRNRKHPAQQ